MLDAILAQDNGGLVAEDAAGAAAGAGPAGGGVRLAGCGRKRLPHTGGVHRRIRCVVGGFLFFFLFGFIYLCHSTVGTSQWVQTVDTTVGTHPNNSEYRLSGAAALLAYRNREAIPELAAPGIEPGTLRMVSKRVTTDLTSTLPTSYILVLLVTAGSAGPM